MTDPTEQQVTHPLGEFPSPDDFPSFDEVDSTTVELPADSYDDAAADDADEAGC